MQLPLLEASQFFSFCVGFKARGLRGRFELPYGRSTSGGSELTLKLHSLGLRLRFSRPRERTINPKGHGLPDTGHGEGAGAGGHAGERPGRLCTGRREVGRGGGGWGVGGVEGFRAC